MLGRVSSSSAARHDPSLLHHNLLPTDEEDSDEGDDAAAIAEALLGRQLIPRPANGRNLLWPATRQAALEEGQLCEDEVDPHHLLTKTSHDISPKSVEQPAVTSLLHRLGPPSQSASLTSAGSSGRRNFHEQPDSHLPSAGGAAPLQSQLDEKSQSILPDHDQKSFSEFRTSRGQKRPQSPRRRRINSRSRSPNRNRHSPPLCDSRRRGSLSARITLNHRRNSCSPDSIKLDFSARSKRIARRFSSPSNSSHYRRDRDPRERETSSSSRYHPNASSDPRRSRQHPDLHPPCKPVVEEPNSPPSSNVQIAYPTSSSKSPSLKSPRSLNTVPPKTSKVSILVANLPSYYVLTPKRLFEHLTDSVYPQRCQPGRPYELKLYRYARSDCVVAELKFNSLDDARHFTRKVDRTWPALWYTSKKLPPTSRQKNVDFTILEDKQISWPSNYETYSPKMKSDLYCPTPRAVQEGEIASGEQTEGQLFKSPNAALSVAESAAATSTPKSAKDKGASLAKLNSKPDYYRPKFRRPSQDAAVVVEERKHQPPPLQPHSEKCETALNAMPTLVNGSRSPSAQALKDANTSLAKVDLGSDDDIMAEKQTNSSQAIANSDEPKQCINQAPTSVNVSASVPESASEESLPSMMNSSSVIQKVPESANSKLNRTSPIAESNQDLKSSVMLSNLHPSLTWPVLQSHFSFPNRPRHFRIFEPFQVAYGSFFYIDPARSSIDDSAASQQGCMISFNDTNTARNFCRVLRQNAPFQSVQICLVDAADIQFVPSASIIRKPHNQDYGESVTAIDPANQFIQNSLLDFQQQLNWTSAVHSEMQSPAAVPMEITPLLPIPNPQFTGPNFAMQPGLNCSVYPFAHSHECHSTMLDYPQSCSSVPMRYPYNPPGHDIQNLSAPMAPHEGFNITPNNPFENKPDTQQELQDRLKKILQERKAKSNQ